MHLLLPLPTAMTHLTIQPSFCALWVPIVYCFFPETNQLELEDIDHIFEGGDKITRGVFGAKGGRTVERSVHERNMSVAGLAPTKRESYVGDQVEVQYAEMKV
jgi:hypothetical protein